MTADRRLGGLLLVGLPLLPPGARLHLGAVLGPQPFVLGPAQLGHLGQDGLAGVDLVPVGAHGLDLCGDLRVRSRERDRVPAIRSPGAPRAPRCFLRNFRGTPPRRRPCPPYEVLMDRPRWISIASSTCSWERTLIRTFISRSLPLVGSMACSWTMPSASTPISMLTGDPAGSAYSRRPSIRPALSTRWLAARSGLGRSPPAPRSRSRSRAGWPSRCWRPMSGVHRRAAASARR